MLIEKKKKEKQVQSWSPSLPIFSVTIGSNPNKLCILEISKVWGFDFFFIQRFTSSKFKCSSVAFERKKKYQKILKKMASKNAFVWKVYLILIQTIIPASFYPCSCSQFLLCHNFGVVVLWEEITSQDMNWSKVISQVKWVDLWHGVKLVVSWYLMKH